MMMALKFFEEYALNGIIKWSSQSEQDQNIVYCMGIEAESVIWTDLKAVGFPK